MRHILLAIAAFTLILPTAAPSAPPQPTTQTVALSPSPRTRGEGRGEGLDQLRSDTPNVWSHLETQLHHILTKDPALSPDELTSLSPEDRDIVTTVIQGLLKFRHAVQSQSTPTVAEKTKPLLEMADAIKDRANLTVSNVTLCESVDRFGVYEPLPSTELSAGQETPVILYCEVDNFHPRQTPGENNMWETRLTYELVLYTETDPSISVYSKPPMPVFDRCRNRRRDFFLADKITLPAKLPAGRYIMKVSVTDTEAKRIGEATLPLQIRGKQQ